MEVSEGSSKGLCVHTADAPKLGIPKNPKILRQEGVCWNIRYGGCCLYVSYLAGIKFRTCALLPIRKLLGLTMCLTSESYIIHAGRNTKAFFSYAYRRNEIYLRLPFLLSWHLPESDLNYRKERPEQKASQYHQPSLKRVAWYHGCGRESWMQHERKPNAKPNICFDLSHAEYHLQSAGDPLLRSYGWDMYSSSTMLWGLL